MSDLTYQKSTTLPCNSLWNTTLQHSSPTLRCNTFHKKTYPCNTRRQTTCPAKLVRSTAALYCSNTNTLTATLLCNILLQRSAPTLLWGITLQHTFEAPLCSTPLQHSSPTLRENGPSQKKIHHPCATLQLCNSFLQHTLFVRPSTRYSATVFSNIPLRC